MVQSLTFGTELSRQRISSKESRGSLINLIHQTIQVAAVRLIRVNELLSRLKTLLFEFVASIGVVNQRSE
jgi:hypothetical protein